MPLWALPILDQYLSVVRMRVWVEASVEVHCKISNFFLCGLWKNLVGFFQEPSIFKVRHERCEGFVPSVEYSRQKRIPDFECKIYCYFLEIGS